MNRVDRSDDFARSGRRLVTDIPASLQGTPSPPPPPDVVEHLDFEPERPEGLQAWAGRITAGLAVQGLVDAEGNTYITCVLNGACHTFEVAPEHAAEAFLHPFAYGCELPL